MEQATGEIMMLTIGNIHSSRRLKFVKVSFGENTMKTLRLLFKNPNGYVRKGEGLLSLPHFPMSA